MDQIFNSYKKLTDLSKSVFFLSHVSIHLNSPCNILKKYIDQLFKLTRDNISYMYYLTHFLNY